MKVVRRDDGRITLKGLTESEAACIRGALYRMRRAYDKGEGRESPIVDTYGRTAGALWDRLADARIGM